MYGNRLSSRVARERGGIISWPGGRRGTGRSAYRVFHSRLVEWRSRSRIVARPTRSSAWKNTAPALSVTVMALGPRMGSRGGGRRRVLPSDDRHAAFYRWPSHDTGPRLVVTYREHPLASCAHACVSGGGRRALRRAIGLSPFRSRKTTRRPPPREPKPGPSAMAVSDDAAAPFFRADDRARRRARPTAVWRIGPGHHWRRYATAGDENYQG